MNEATYYDDIYINCDCDYEYEKTLPANNFVPTINYIEKNSLKSEDLDIEVNYLIDDFLVKQGIHMLFAKASQGKTYFSMALSLFLLKQKKVSKVYYLDMDNPTVALKQRGLQQIIEKYPDFIYLHRSKGDIRPADLLQSLADDTKTIENAYEGYFFVFDSIRDFLGSGRSLNDDRDVIVMMSALKDIRDAGATVVFLHHTNRSSDGELYKGSSSFIDSIDIAYALKSQRTQSGMSYQLTQNKDRLAVKDTAFDLITDGEEMELIPQDFNKKNMSEVELEVVENCKKVLEDNSGGISQSELLAKIGRKANCGSGIKYLKKYIGTHWKSKQIADNNTINYYPLTDKERETYES